MKTKILSILALLLTVTQGAWAQSLPTDGTGAYTIGSKADWETFCTDVNSGNNYNGKTVKLTADVSGITTMVGSSENNSFQGTFDGGSHTLTFTIGTSKSAFNEQYCALFRYVKNATIQNLKVAGNIYTAQQFAAGLVARPYGSINITDCQVSTVIYSSVNGDGTHGGLVVRLEKATGITITGCVFTGRLLTNNGTNYCGGFIGWGDNKSVNISNSLYAPDSSIPEGWTAINHEKTFVRGANPTLTDCYFTEAMGDAQGMQVFTVTPADEIYKQVTAADGNDYYASPVSNVEHYYKYTGSVISVTPTVTFGSTTLTADVDYTYTISPATVQEKGDYTLTITGKGNYSGTKTIQFAVVEKTPITSGSTALSTGEYMVYEDVTINSRINISGNVTLILGEGTTLNAKKGIELSGSNSLTINGLGTLTIDGCDNGKSGIGSGSGGTLTVNGGTINANGGSYAAGIGGSMNNWGVCNVTINGGVVNARGGRYSAGIGGAYDDGSGNYGGDCGTIIINGGQVTATGGGGNSRGIGIGEDGDAYKGSLTIGWTNLTDFVLCDVNLNTVSFAPGKLFVFDGTKILANTNSFRGKKIVPFELSDISGEGTELSPYLISNDNDWATLAYYVNNGTNNYSNKFVRLEANINVSPMLGTSEGNSFQGTILGNNKTLTFNSGTGTAQSPFNEENCAPFRYVKNATIRDLKVVGDIRTNQKLAAGLVARPYGTTTISNCHVSTVIYSSKNGDGAHGGIVAMPSGTLNIDGCSYTGRLLTNNSTYNCSGFVGWFNNTTVSITNSLYAPSGSIPSGWSAINHENTFVRGGSPTITNCYFTETLGNAQGAQAYTVLPDNEICKVLTFNSITVYLTPVCAVSGVEDSYLLSESPSITPVVTFNENALNFGTDYTATLDGENVATFPVSPDEMGTYTLIFTGAGDYAGAKTVEFMWLPAPNEGITFTDANTYTLKTDVNVASATYTKTLGSDRVGKHQAWFVPFDYTITEDDLEKFTFYKIDMIAHSPDPSQETSDDIWVFVKRMADGDVLHGNMPYVYKPKQAVDNYQFTTQNAVLKAKTDVARITMMTAEETYTLYGTYEPTTATAEDPFYYVNINGGISLGNNGSVTVGAFRWIMRQESKFGGSTPVAYAREIYFFDGESNETTGIVSLTPTPSPKEDGSCYYTLDGRKINGKPTAKGMYIHHGVMRVIK